MNPSKSPYYIPGASPSPIIQFGSPATPANVNSSAQSGVSKAKEVGAYNPASPGYNPVKLEHDLIKREEQ